MWDWATNMTWVVSYRNESLNSFFQFFPFLASDTFYFLIISFGYWFRGSPFYRDLGILVALGTLLNVALKTVFQVPRPSITHLVDTYGTYGFPSGDIQVAAMVWLLLAWRFKKLWFTIFSLFVILGIGFSRMYLGVHSAADIIGGFLIGLLPTAFYIKFNRIPLFPTKSGLLMTLLTFTIALIGYLAYPLPAFLWAVPLGGLLGISLALFCLQIHKKLSYPMQGSLMKTMTGLVVLFIIKHFMPSVRASTEWVVITTFAFLAFLVIFLIPYGFAHLKGRKPLT